MGVWGMMSSCCTNPNAKNPCPENWELVGKIDYPDSYVLVAKYHGCTNFEGLKVMVYRGKYKHQKSLDPHFSDSDDSPIARFKPTPEGILMACELAKSLTMPTH